jgi:hypothetical protein
VCLRKRIMIGYLYAIRRRGNVPMSLSLHANNSLEPTLVSHAHRVKVGSDAAQLNR